MKIRYISSSTIYMSCNVKFNDGMIKILAHDTNMKIPIFNSFMNQIRKLKQIN